MPLLGTKMGFSAKRGKKCADRFPELYAGPIPSERQDSHHRPSSTIKTTTGTNGASPPPP